MIFKATYRLSKFDRDSSWDTYIIFVQYLMFRFQSNFNLYSYFQENYCFNNTVYELLQFIGLVLKNWNIWKEFIKVVSKSFIEKGWCLIAVEKLLEVFIWGHLELSMVKQKYQKKGKQKNVMKKRRNRTLMKSSTRKGLHEKIKRLGSTDKSWKEEWMMKN